MFPCDNEVNKLVTFQHVYVPLMLQVLQEKLVETLALPLSVVARHKNICSASCKWHLQCF